MELLEILKKYFQLELGENEEAQRWFENWNRVRVVYKSNYQTYIDSVIADNGDTPNGFTPQNWNNPVSLPDVIYQHIRYLLRSRPTVGSSGRHHVGMR